MSIVRKNLMNEAGYSPYCGYSGCRFMYPRTVFNGKQFVCKCGWTSDFPEEFIEEYKKKWGLK